MKASDFKSLGPVTINSKRLTLYEHYHLNWFKFGKCQVQAKTREEAIEKLKSCKLKLK